MTLEGTILVQAALSVLGGIVTIMWMLLHRKTTKGILLLPLWFFYTFYIFWGMAAVRLLLLYDGIPVYSENMYLMLFDMTVAVGSTLFLLATARQQTKACFCMKIVGCVALAVIDGLQFVIFVRRYENMNAALYRVLRPDTIVLQGLVVMGCYLIMDRILGSDRCKKHTMPVAVALLCVITLYLAPSFETLLTNTDELLFGVGDVWYMFVIFGVAVFVAVILLLLLVPSNRSRIFCTGLWACCICAYLQGMLLNGSLFLMDGKKLEWSAGLKISNLILWCACLAGLMTLCRFVRHAQKLITYSSFILCAMQIVGVVSLIPVYHGDGIRGDVQYENYLSMEGICEVASEENVIVFVLDTYDVDFLEQVLDIQTDFLEPMRGFTYFPDNVSQFSRTFPSIPYMLTEETYFYEEPLADYVERAFSGCMFWEGLRKEGYQYYLFEESEDVIGSTVLKASANFVTRGEVLAEQYSFPGCAETAVKIGSYRLAPYALKDRFVYT